MDIFLNGHRYVLRTGTAVSRSPHPEWIQPVPETGERTRSQRTELSTHEFGGVSAGLGIERADLSNPRDRISMWDSELNTLFPGQKTLPPLRQVSSFSVFDTLFMPPRWLQNFGDYAEGIGSHARALTTGSYNVEGVADNAVKVYSVLVKWAAGGWGACPTSTLFSKASTVGTTIGGIGSEANILHLNMLRDKHIVLWARLGFKDGGVATTRAMLNITESPTVGHFGVGSCYLVATLGVGFDPTRLINLSGLTQYHTDNKLWVFWWDWDGNRGNLEVGYYDAGVYTKDFTYGIQSSPTGVASYYDRSNASALFLCFPDRLVQIDSINNTLITVLDLSAESSEGNGRGMCVWQGKLMIPTKKGMIAFNYDGSYEVVGLDLDSGLPAKKDGVSSGVTAHYDHLLQAIRAEEACVYDLHDGGWHFMTKGAVASQPLDPVFLSSKPDEVPRLHWMAGTLPYFIERPFDNPLEQGPNLKCATEGKITYPMMDFGLPEDKMGLFAEYIEAEQLGGGNEVRAFFGIDGVAPTAELGRATTAGRLLAFGTYGTQGRIYQAQFNLLRGSSQGTTPVLRTPVLQYLKKPDARYVYRAVVDIETTAKERREMSGEENILREIGSLMESKVLLPFHYGKIPTKKVLVFETPSEETHRGRGVTEMAAERTGLIDLRLVEMLPPS